MSDDNNKSQLDNNKDDSGKDSQQQNQEKKVKSLLEYHLLPYEGGVVFQIVSQHPAVTAFLEQQPYRLFTAANGVRISTGTLFPQWKESDNFIYLDGTMGARLKKIDKTYFQTMFANQGRTVRDNKIRLFKNALEELVDTVKETFEEELKVDLHKREKGKVRIVLA